MTNILQNTTQIASHITSERVATINQTFAQPINARYASKNHKKLEPTSLSNHHGFIS
jgi:hypothetical protein